LQKEQTDRKGGEVAPPRVGTGSVPVPGSASPGAWNVSASPLCFQEGQGGQM